jgi:glycine/D-amino acid oxidase-like deaminating enzyme
MRFGQESGPLVGGTTIPGLWVAAGHTCWGIQNGPGTGKLMSEFIFDGQASSADVRKLDPKKFKV